MTEPTIEKSIEQRVAELMAAAAHAAATGDMDKVIAIGREAASLKRGQEDAIAKLTESDRVNVKDALTLSLPRVNFRELARAAKVTGTIRRTDSGLDDGEIGVVLPGLMDLVWEKVKESGAENVPSVKRITFTIEGGKADVQVLHTGAGSSKGGGGGGGKGWVKDGVVYKLGDVFDAHATDDQKAKIVGLDSNGSFTLKKLVAKAAGYTQNAA